MRAAMAPPRRRGCLGLLLAVAARAGHPSQECALPASLPTDDKAHPAFNLLRRHGPPLAREMDVVMPVHKPGCVVERAVKNLNENFGPRRIIVATQKNNCRTLQGYARNVLCLDEDRVLPNVTKAKLAKVIKLLQDDKASAKALKSNGYGGHSAAGWYLQQFIKLGLAQSPLLHSVPLSEAFLVWDSDMILLRKLEAFTPDGRIQLMSGGRCYLEQHKKRKPCYAHAYEHLTGGMRLIWSSNAGEDAEGPSTSNDMLGYVSHHMVMKRPYVKELLRCFGSEDWPYRALQAACGGKATWDECRKGFSEYFNMASWMKTHHTEAVVDVPQNFVRFEGEICCPDDAFLNAYKAKGVLFLGIEQGECSNETEKSTKSPFAVKLLRWSGKKRGR